MFPALLVLPKKQGSLERKVCWYFRGILRRFGSIDRWFSVYKVCILYIALEEGGKQNGALQSDQ